MCDVKQSQNRAVARAISIGIVFVFVAGIFIGATNLMNGTVTAADIFEPDDTPGEANEISTDGTLQDHDFDPAGEVDWINFTSTSGNLYTIETSNLGGGADTLIHLYDSDGTTVLMTNDDGGSESLASKIAWQASRSDNFYVEIEDIDSVGGTYSINVTESTPPPGDAYEVDDDFTAANFIATNGTIQNHTLHYSGDWDWLNFTATNGMFYTIETHNLGGSTDTGLVLMDTNGSTPLTMDNDGGVGLASKIEWSAPRNDYFYVFIIEVNEGSGPGFNYSINITESTPPPGDSYEPDNDYTEASTIPTNGTIQSHTFHVSGDEDWVEFTTTSGNSYNIVTFNLGSSVDIELFLYDTDGTTELDYSDQGVMGDPEYIQWICPTNGDYYVRIGEYYGSGGEGYSYDINISESIPPAGDMFEPDDVYTAASNISTNGTIQNHTFHIPNDEDWVTFTATSGSLYTIETFNLGDADTEITLYDTDGTTILDYDDDSGNEFWASKIEWTATSNGDFYVLINELDGDAGPTYTYDFRIIGTSPIGAPTNLNTTFGDSYVNITWNPPDSIGGSPITNYTIYRGTILGNETLLAEVGNVSYYNDTTVTNGVTYYYNISAKNINGEGENSSLSVTPMCAPSAPMNSETTFGDSYVNITWNPPTSLGGSPITNYRIYRGTTLGDETFLAEVGNVSYYNDTTVTNGITYYYNVSAKNINGEGENSSLSVTPLYVPSEPLNVQILIEDDCLNLTWDSPSSNGGSNITRYKVYRGTASGDGTLMTFFWVEQYYNDTEVDPGTTYYYYVIAHNSVGDSVPSIEVSEEIPGLSTQDFNGLSYTDVAGDDYTFYFEGQGTDTTVTDSWGEQGKYPGVDIVSLEATLNSGNVTVTVEFTGDITDGPYVFFMDSSHQFDGRLLNPQDVNDQSFIYSWYDFDHMLAYMKLENDGGSYSYPYMTSVDGDFSGKVATFTVSASELQRAGVTPGSGFGLYAFCRRVETVPGAEWHNQITWDMAGVGAAAAPAEFNSDTSGPGTGGGDKSGDSGLSSILLYLVIAIIIVCVVVAVLLMRKRRGGAEEVSVVSTGEIIEPETVAATEPETVAVTEPLVTPPQPKAVAFKCPHCGKPFKAKPSQEPQKVNCPSCQGIVKLPPIHPQEQSMQPPQPQKQTVQTPKPSYMTFNCPLCGKPFKVKPTTQAIVIACPSCGGQTKVGPT